MWYFSPVTAYQNSIKNDAIVLNHKTQSFLTICPEHLRLPDVGFHNSKTHRRMSLEVTFTVFFTCINLYFLNVFFFLNTITFNLYKMLRICRHQSSFYFMLVEDLQHLDVDVCMKSSFVFFWHHSISSLTVFTLGFLCKSLFRTYQGAFTIFWTNLR